MKLFNQVFASKTSIQVLRKLCIQKDWQFTVSELARDLGIDKSLVSKAVVRLENENAVKTLTKGRSKLCQINSGNVIVRDVLMSSFEKEGEIERGIIQKILKKLRPERFKSIVSILTYGSFPAGEFRLRSDIDLMIVTKNEGEHPKIKTAMELVSDEFSKTDDLLLFVEVVVRKNFRKMYQLKEPLFVEIVKSGKRIYGTEIMELK